jgi:hypothetical protein
VEEVYEDEHKVGDNLTDRSKDLRYDIDAIIENSVCPKFDKRGLYNWNIARVYSVIDIIGHPMHIQAKIVLSRHLQRLQMIEAQQAENNNEQAEVDSEDYPEGEESESSGEFDEEALQKEANAQIKGIPRPGSNSSNISGLNKYGNQLPSKEQVIEQYDKTVIFRQQQFVEFEARLEEEKKEDFYQQKEQFFKQLFQQKEEMLLRISDRNSQVDEAAFSLGEDSGSEDSESEEEEEEKEDEQEVDQNVELEIDQEEDHQEEDQQVESEVYQQMELGANQEVDQMVDNDVDLEINQKVEFEVEQEVDQQLEQEVDLEVNQKVEFEVDQDIDQEVDNEEDNINVGESEGEVPISEGIKEPEGEGENNQV